MVQSPEERRREIRLYPMSEDELKAILWGNKWPRIPVYLAMGAAIGEGVADLATSKYTGFAYFSELWPALIGIIGFVALTYSDSLEIKKRVEVIRRRLRE